MRLQDKVVLITSVRNPCVEAIAKGFAREGANFVLFDQDLNKAEGLAVELRSVGRRALCIESDVTVKTRLKTPSAAPPLSSDVSTCC